MSAPLQAFQCFECPNDRFWAYVSYPSSFTVMRPKMELDHFPDCLWLHQHSAPILGHIAEFRYLTRACISCTSLCNCRGFSSQPREPPFQSAAVPTPTETTLTQNHRFPDSGLFYASSQVTRLKLETPPYPRENNNKLKTMSPLSVFGGEDWGSQPQRGGRGIFGEGMGPFWGRHGMKLNK